MNRQQRLVQHKPERELTKNQEVSLLRQENRQLRKQVARLRKELERFETQETEAKDPTPLVEDKALSCTACEGTDFVEFSPPNRSPISICKQCRTKREPDAVSEL